MKACNYGLFLAVLPKYREECIELLRKELGDDLEIEVAKAHLDTSVRTGIRRDLYRQTPMLRIGGKLFIQFPRSLMSVRVANLVVDLNPRSLSIWPLLLIRKILRRRTLVWGHLHPQAGGTAKSAWLRRVMRRLADGTVSYTYRDRDRATRELPGKPVWVAANSLYLRSMISASTSESDRNCLIYVGRFEEAKKVDLLIRSFALAAQFVDGAKLLLIGGGSMEERLRGICSELGLGTELVEFVGWVDDVDELRKYYSRSFASASPGFAGLGLTQSLGFGVPMIVAENEQHSPEIELATDRRVSWFASDSPAAMAKKIELRWKIRGSVPLEEASAYVRDHYSADSMSRGLAAALTGSDESHV